MKSSLGVVAALASSATWAYASAQYALASREVSPARVNLVRMACSLPVFVIAAIATGASTAHLDTHACGWLTISTLCSYAFADNLFFASARRIGVSSALAIASSYPLWSALKGTLFDGEAFGPARAVGTVLCVGGVVTIIRLSAPAKDAAPAADAPRDRIGVPLAIACSFLWAGNTIAIKAGSIGLSLATVNSFRYTVALVVLGAYVALGRATGARRPARGWLPMMPAILCDCVFGSAFFVYGLVHTDLAVGATLSSLAPLLSLPFAIWLGAERLSIGKFLAVTTTVAGIVLLAAY